MSSRVEQATWTKIIEQNGFSQQSQGLATGDPFAMLAARAQQMATSGYPIAHMTLGLTNGKDYGQVKVHVSLNVPIVPMEADISLAGEAAFIKVLQMVNEASAAMGIPPLE